MSLVAPRRKTRVLNVGDVKIGGDSPIAVQSMATADTRDPKATLAQIAELADAIWNDGYARPRCRRHERHPAWTA